LDIRLMRLDKLFTFSLFGFEQLRLFTRGFQLLVKKAPLLRG
jgi:hypothetical protein